MSQAEQRTKDNAIQIVQNYVAGSMANISFWDQDSHLWTLRFWWLVISTVWVLSQALIAISYQGQLVSWSNPGDIQGVFRACNIVTLVLALFGFIINVLTFVNDKAYSVTYYQAQVAVYAAIVWAFIPQVTYTGTNFSGESEVHMTNALSAYVTPVPIYLLVAAWALSNLRRPTLEGPSLDFIDRSSSDLAQVVGDQGWEQRDDGHRGTPATTSIFPSRVRHR